MTQIKSKVFIIAELSANHNGDLQVALETVRAAKRPGFGMHPKYLSELLGKEFKKDFKKGTPLSPDFFKQ